VTTALADVFTKEVRSQVMQTVRSKENKSTELRIIKLFRENSISGWRRNYLVKGRPDFVFLNKRLAIFVDGCFWHGHDCRNTRPSDNAEYWAKKRERNIQRDKNITAAFENRKWTVIRIWECELSKKKQDLLNNKLGKIKQ
jgi:DNA mismatch endonuclease (patch repair protein)